MPRLTSTRPWGSPPKSGPAVGGAQKTPPRTGGADYEGY